MKINMNKAIAKAIAATLAYDKAYQKYSDTYAAAELLAANPNFNDTYDAAEKAYVEACVAFTKAAVRASGGTK